MNKRIYSLLTVVCIVLNLMVYFPLPTFAATYGDLTYEIENNQVIITDCKHNATNVDVPDYIDGFPVTTIGERAFENCDRIASLIIGDNVTTISWRAFFSCNELTEMTIGSNVNTIGKYAFRYCENLTSIKVNANNQFFCDINGVLFDKNKTKIIKYPEGRTDSTYVIPNSITTIGESAFEFNCFITDVTIGNSVTIIEKEAFLCCNNLARVIIPDGVATIGKDSFRSCDSLKSVEIGDSITTIDERAFEECENLASVTLGNGITFIGESAFRLCDYLENVYYGGTKEKWDDIIIQGRNTGLSNATIHFDKENSNNKSNWKSNFSDVSEDHWAYDAIMELADLGVINGMGDGTYNPDGTVTREQFIKLLVCANDEDNDFYPDVDFADVDDNSWSYEYICTGLSNGIFGLNELEDDKFEPQKGIDRDTVALWAVNTLGVWLDEESSFSDNYKINNSEAVATAVDEGIIKGYEDNTFRPNNTLTRAEAAAIIKRTIDKIADNKNLRFSPNKVTYSDDVEYRLDYYELDEFDEKNKYCKIEEPGLIVANLQEGDILAVEPDEHFPSGFAMKIKRIQRTGRIVEFWGEDVKTEEVFDKIDISTMINGDLGYVAENSVPKGIELTNAKGQTIAMAKEALKADNNYFYASTGGFQQTLKGTEELNLLKFKLEYEKDSHTKISGEITVLNPQFVVDLKFNKLSGLEYAELKAVLSCDAEVKYEKKLESREEDLTRIPLAKLVMPVGATGLYLEGDLYCDVGIDGKVEVKFETSQSFETGIKYENKKLKNIKEQKNESAISATAEGAIKFGPNTELTLSAYGVINLKFEFEAGLKLNLESAKEIKEENDVIKYHKCDLCIDGDLCGYFEVGGDITFGKGIFKVTLIEAKNEWEYVMADFYISRQFDEDNFIFDWGECDNFAGDTVILENNDDNGIIEPFNNNINALGNIYSNNFAISDGKYIYFNNGRSQIYRTDLNGSNQMLFVDFGDPAFYSINSMCIYNNYLYTVRWKFISKEVICKVSLNSGKYEEWIDFPVNIDNFQIVNGFLLFSENNKIYKLSLNATSYDEKVFLADGVNPIYYNGLIFYQKGLMIYKMNFEGEEQNVVLRSKKSNNKYSDIIVYNEKIYFRDNKCIYSANLDGTNIILLHDKRTPIQSLRIHNDQIYFATSGYYETEHDLICMSLNGDNIRTVSSGCKKELCIVGEWFYSKDTSVAIYRGKDMIDFEAIKK